MSSSLEYILSSLDEETQAVSSATLAYPCYESNSPWIASSLTSSQPAPLAYAESDGALAIRRIRESPQFYPHPRAVSTNTNRSSFTTSSSAASAVPTSGAYFTYVQPSYTDAMMARRSSGGGTSMSMGMATSYLPSPYLPNNPSITSPITAAANAALARAQSPLNFAYRPRSQQERLRTLFPNEDETSLQEMTRAVAAITRASEARGERAPWMNLNAHSGSFLGGGLFAGIGASSFGETEEVNGGSTNAEEESIQTIDFGSQGEEEEEDSESEEANNSDLATVLRNMAAAGTVHAPPSRTAAAGAGSRLEHLGETTLGDGAARCLAQLDQPQEAAAGTTYASASRARRQPAISSLERLPSPSIDGNGEQSDDDEAEDVKPSAAKTTLRKRNQPDPTTEEPSSKKHKSDNQATCCICLEIPTKEDLASISGCSHPFCFSCIEKWADRENTCPLCKSRFHKIEKLHGKSSEKNVTNRNQRSDLGFMGGMDLFGGMGLESTGTWPTHIAQLLFSGLGASSIRGTSDRAPMGGRDIRTGRFIPSASAHHLYEPFAAPAPPRVGYSTRRPQAFASSLSGAGLSSSNNNAAVEPLDRFLDRVNAHRVRENEQRQQLQALTDNLEATTSVYSSTSLLGTSTTTYPFHTTTTRSTVTTTTTMAGPPLNPFGSIDLSQREEEDILASTSPTSYFRMHHDLDRNTDRYQFSTSPSGAAARVSAANWATLESAFASNEAGRSAETALEIDDSDDDEVEVVAVEAVM